MSSLKSVHLFLILLSSLLRYSTEELLTLNPVPEGMNRRKTVADYVRLQEAEENVDEVRIPEVQDRQALIDFLFSRKLGYDSKIAPDSVVIWLGVVFEGMNSLMRNAMPRMGQTRTHEFLECPNFWISVEWKDSRLKWDPRNFQGLSSLSLSPSQDLIWEPGTNGNLGPLNLFECEQSSMSLHSSGWVSWVNKCELRIRCDSNLNEEDELEEVRTVCQVKFGLWSADEESFDLRFKNQTQSGILQLSDTDEEMLNVEVKAKRQVKRFSGIKDKFIEVIYILSRLPKPISVGLHGDKPVDLEAVVENE